MRLIYSWSSSNIFAEGSVDIPFQRIICEQRIGTNGLQVGRDLLKSMQTVSPVAAKVLLISSNLSEGLRKIHMFRFGVSLTRFWDLFRLGPALVAHWVTFLPHPFILGRTTEATPSNSGVRDVALKSAWVGFCAKCGERVGCRLL